MEIKNYGLKNPTLSGAVREGVKKKQGLFWKKLSNREGMLLM